VTRESARKAIKSQVLISPQNATVLSECLLKTILGNTPVQVICNDLFSRNLIEFTENPRHKRSKLAKLTELGRHALQQAQQKEYQVIEQLFPEIELEKAAETCRMLARIRKAMENLPDSGNLEIETD